jgi:hypothetical protein
MIAHLPSVRPRRPILAGAAAVLATVGLLGACSGGTATSGISTAPSSTAGASAPESNPPGDIPDNQVFVPYSPPAGGYRVKVPEGWQRTELPGGATFTDKLNSVTVQRSSVATAPTVESVRAAGAPTAAAPTSKYRDARVEQVSLPAGQAIRATYTADGAPDPVTGKTVTDDVVVYTLAKGGTQVELVLAGPHGADNVDPWKIVSDSIGWTP